LVKNVNERAADGMLLLKEHYNIIAIKASSVYFVPDG